MKKYIIPVILGLSVLLNIVLICILFFNNSNEDVDDKESASLENVSYRTSVAQSLMREIVCPNMYFPESYDPISTSADSAFHGPLTDAECLKAAMELAKYKAQLPGAEDHYKETVHTLKIFGSSGVFWRHAEEKKEAEEKVKSLKDKIAKRENIIRQRNTSHDGEFIGWLVSHRYRARTKGGDITISDVLYLVNPEMTGWLFRYSVDEHDTDNLKALDKVIRETLGTYTEED